MIFDRWSSIVLGLKNVVQVMYKDDKKYHMDLKENARGRFLKVSETFTRGYSRFQVFIPAEGMREFQQNLGELIDEYDNGKQN